MSTDIFGFLMKAHSKVKREYDPDATNIGINNGDAAGQTAPHLHWHIIPQYKGDIEDLAGGVRGAIPEKMKYEGD